MRRAKARSQRSNRAVAATVVTVLGLLVVYPLVLEFVGGYLVPSPLEKLAKRYSHVDEQRLHWDYPALLTAYRKCRNSMDRERLFDLMVVSRAAHFVPDIIDSITPGGFMDTEKKIRAIIRLTGHDFSKEFDIAGVWQPEPTRQAQEKLRQWWDQNQEAVLKTRGPKDVFDVPNRWSNLRLHLRTEKSTYLQAEPVRLTAVLENASDVWHTFAYRYPTPAYKITFHYVSPAGEETPIAETQNPKMWVFCGLSWCWLQPVEHFVMYPGSSEVTQQWGNVADETYFDLGKGMVRAVLTPLYGRHKGKRLVSNDVDIEIVAPQGPDALAHQFLMSTQAIKLGNGREVRPYQVRLSGLARNGWSNYASGADDYFIDTYGDSVYAHYVRFTQADVAKWYRDEARYRQPPDTRYAGAGPKLAKRLSEIVSEAPRDFPLLADAYADLLAHYQQTGEIDEMEAVAETVDVNDMTIVDSALRRRLAALIEYPREMIANVNREDFHGRFPLHVAAEKGPIGLVRFLLRRGADVNAKCRWGTPLFIAAKAGHTRIVEILIASGADINAAHGDRPPLYWPVVNGQEEIVRLLLAHGAEVNYVDKDGRALVEHALSQRRSAEVVRMLMTARGQGGKTPLHWAVERGRLVKIEKLMRNGAPLDIVDDQGRTPLDLARLLATGDSERAAIADYLQGN